MSEISLLTRTIKYEALELSPSYKSQHGVLRVRGPLHRYCNAISYLVALITHFPFNVVVFFSFFPPFFGSLFCVQNVHNSRSLQILRFTNPVYNLFLL